MSKSELGGSPVSRRRVLELTGTAAVVTGVTLLFDRTILLRDQPKHVLYSPGQAIPEVPPSLQKSPTDSLAQSQIGLNRALADQAAAQKRLLDAQADSIRHPQKEDPIIKYAPLGTVGLTGVGLIAAGWQYGRTRKDEIGKAVEARFEGLVTTIGGATNPKERAGAVIALRTYLQEGKESFYPQVFDLAVAHLRSDDSGKTRQPDSVNKALVQTFIQAFPLVRDSVAPELATMEERGLTIDNLYVQEAMKRTDASSITLDNANCGFSDFKGGWLAGASFNRTNFFKADLDRTVVVDSDFTGAIMKETKLSEAIATGANFSDATLTGTLILRSNLTSANFEGAKLKEVYLLGSNLTDSNIELAEDLTGTQISVGSGLTDSQVQQCEAKGATFIVLPEPSAQTKPNKRIPPGGISIIYK